MRIVLLPRAIRHELERLDARELTLENLGDGYAALRRDTGEPFRRQGRARDILDLLRAMPDGAGPDAVVSALEARD